MPYTVPVSFDKFLATISISGDQQSLCTTRKDHIVSLLKNHFTILDAFSTGSIPKRTAIKGSDLDVMVVLHYGKHISGKTPAEVLKTVREALSEYRTGARKNGQAVTLSYKTWPDVDIVPVYKTTEGDTLLYYNVPDENRGVWLESKPNRHAINIAERVKSYGPEFRRIIRMLKWWNRNHSEYLSSYHIEVMALNILSGTFSEYPWEVYKFFDNAANLVASSLSYEGYRVDSYLSSLDRQEAISRLNRAKEKSLTAWHATYGANNDDRKAIELWCQVFGDGFPKYAS